MIQNGTRAAQRLFGAYYGATAVFVLLDFVVGFNIRVAFLSDLPGWRLTWYLLCGLCFLSIWCFPAWTSTVAATESLLNLAALIIAMGSRVIVPTAEILDTGAPPVSPGEILNFLISGSAASAALWFRSRRFRNVPLSLQTQETRGRLKP